MRDGPPEGEARREAEDSPTAWFVVLERARETHDFARAAEAQKQLERLGVKVTYTTPKPSRRGGTPQSVTTERIG